MSLALFVSLPPLPPLTSSYLLSLFRWAVWLILIMFVTFITFDSINGLFFVLVSRFFPLLLVLLLVKARLPLPLLPLPPDLIFLSLLPPPSLLPLSTSLMVRA